MSHADPPSFRPSGRRTRPPAAGARRIGGRDHEPQEPPRRDESQDASFRDEPQEPPLRTSLRSPAREAVRRGAGGAVPPASRRDPADPRPRRGAPPAGADRPGDRPAPTAEDAGHAPWWDDPSPEEAPGHTRAMPAGAGTPTPPVYAPARETPSEHDHASVVHHAPARTEQPPARAPRPVATPAGSRPARRRRRRRPVRSLVLFLAVLLVAWPAGLMLWADARINHTAALPAGADSPGTTYLLAGSDSRADGAVADGTPGQRADSILLLHRPASGPTALISLPRDTYVQIPGHGGDKLNAAFALGGPPLLTQTVEELTGIGVDHYVEVGMGGVSDVVDAVGGVELCLDYDVQDEYSGLDWSAGCHRADGEVALQFARMRYSDPQGDIGRGARQRQVIGAVADEALSPLTLVNPLAQVRLAGAGTGALVTDPDTGILDLAGMALAFRSATGSGGVVGTPPIASMNYSPGGVGSTVLLDREAAPAFFDALERGDLTAADVSAPPAG